MNSPIETIEVPKILWEEIKKLLDSRSTVSDEEDEENDYEVLEVLNKMREIW